MITPTPALIDWLHGLDSYVNTTLGRPNCPNQCASCGRMSIPTIVTIAVGADGLCPKCRRDRAPHRDVIRLFKPMARKDSNHA